MSETTTDNGTTQADPPDNTTSQSDNDLPEWARDKLSKANNEAATYRIKARDTAAALEAANTQIQTLTTEKTTVTDTATGLALELVKLRTALSVGIPGEHAADFAELLKGDSAEEIKASAERAKNLLGAQHSPSATDPSQGHGGSDTTASPAEGFHGFILGQLGR